MSSILAVIIARGGSKGVPGKNLRLIGSEPLITFIIRSAQDAAKNVDFDLVFSTDSEEIRQVAIAAGVWAPFLRPSELAADNVPSHPVVLHALMQAELLNNKRYDIVVYLQPTAPLCRSLDIVRCINLLIETPSADSVVAVTESEIHPFRMKRMLSDGRLVNYIDQGFEDMRPRQQLPKVYRRAGSIYASRRGVLIDDKTLVGESCFGVVVPSETAVDIDTEMDLKLVQVMHKEINQNY